MVGQVAAKKKAHRKEQLKEQNAKTIAARVGERQLKMVTRDKP